jgi:hypothetical protein
MIETALPAVFVNVNVASATLRPPLPLRGTEVPSIGLGLAFAPSPLGEGWGEGSGARGRDAP